MAAVSSTTAPIFIPSPAEKFPSSSYLIRFPLKQRNNFTVRSSSDAPAQETAAVVDEGPGEAVESVEPSEVPYSIISALNVEKVLRGIAITDADHYGRLGLQRGCSYTEVPIAYKAKCEEVISQGLADEELSQKLELFKESYMILSSEPDRRFYDWSLSRTGFSEGDNYIWPYEVDKTPMSPETPPEIDPEDVGPTRLVGYFMLGWLVLGFTLSIALNL